MITTQKIPPNLGWWSANADANGIPGTPPTTDQQQLKRAIGDILQPITIVEMAERILIREEKELAKFIAFSFVRLAMIICIPAFARLQAMDFAAPPAPTMMAFLPARFW